MSHKLSAGILGATGMVGQKYISLLENHPLFEINYVAASPSSAGKYYSDAVLGRWHMEKNIPSCVNDLIVRDASDVSLAKRSCDFVFSAIDLDKKSIFDLEMEYAKKGIPVVSNNSAHRFTDNVPMIIPEINYNHLKIIPEQKKMYGFDEGFIVVKPNCSLQSYLTPVFALMDEGFKVDKLMITTMQAVSGAGHPGVSSLDIIDNIIPYINGEEEKTEKEPMKILGKIIGNKIKDYEGMKISAHCNRVPVIDGHTACVSIGFQGEKPSLENIIQIWNNFKSLPQEHDFPFAPKKPIIYRHENDRPQPKKDRDVDKGMAVSVGRLRECDVLDVKFVGLSHNTVRGAAGGGILNAELLEYMGYFG